MKQVALISQTLRIRHCQAFLNMAGDAQHVVFTADPASFTHIEFASEPRVVPVTPPPELLPTARLTATRVFRRVLAKARGGSSLGRWLERTIKRFAWRLRYIDRLALLRRSRRVSNLNVVDITTSALYSALLDEHEQGWIDRIVVFDVFDLPVALAFASERDIDVLVR